MIVWEELQANLIVWEEVQATLYLRFRTTYGRDTALEECEGRFECGHHVGWFRVERTRAICTLVLVYVSIRLSESQ
jgi:hypothetical protein